jgi:lipopolysaccharide/colanic/teichoic acid biosynthesis glycosyltransferase
MKRLMDGAVSAVLLLALSPLLLVIALAVRLTSRGPVIYRGLRVGKDGKKFQILKFRTMTVGGAGGAITVADDGRVTRLGRWLRASKLDELPQLMNVLRGDMSLVGPRPEAPEYVAQYGAEQRRVLSVRPGITGPSQIAFRNEQSLLVGQDPEEFYVNVVMPAKLAIDLAYVSDHSLRVDMGILTGTVRAVLLRARSGATRAPGQSSVLLMPQGMEHSVTGAAELPDRSSAGDLLPSVLPPPSDAYLPQPYET